MKAIVFGLFGLLSLGVYAQETDEEFLPIEVEGKEAFMSTKTGEFTFREHAKTDPEQLRTTASGVMYTDISSHVITKGETLSTVAKKNGISVAEIKQHNKVNSSNLKIGSSLKIVKKILVKSSSPVISYAGEEQIIARLRPGESPGQFAAPPSVAEVESKVIKTKKTEEKPTATIYKAETSVKNPIFGLDNPETEETQDNESIENLSEAISQEVNEVKTELKKEKVVVAKAPKIEVKKEIKKESKKEKLVRLKAEMKALEAELQEEEPVKAIVEEEVKEEVKVDEKEAEKVSVVTNEQNTIEANVIEHVKTSNPEAESEEVANDRKVMVFENKPKAKDAIAEKAKQAIASVRKTEKNIEASKIEEINKEKDVANESDSEEKNGEATYYTVVKGNSLWSIAKKHNMTVDALKKLNNIKSNILDVGQKLKVTSKK